MLEKPKDGFILIKTDGIEIGNGSKSSPRRVQAMVGGLIELVPTMKDQVLVNEEGFIRSFPENLDAPSIIEAVTGTPIPHTLYGDVLILIGRQSSHKLEKEG